MNYKALVEKYWTGETSLEEEKALVTYFNSDSVDEELLSYAPMFQYWDKAKKTTLKQPLENLLVKERSMLNRLKVRSKRFGYRSIAATILVLILVGFGYQQMQLPSKAERMATYWANKEIKDPREAFLKTKAALLLVSKKLNKGRETALQQVSKVQQVGQFIKSPD